MNQTSTDKLPVTDEELVRRFQAGDTAAFECFVRRHQDRIYRLALVLLVVADDAHDVLQEVMMRSYTGLAKFAFRAQPTTWLVRTTKNACREFNRRSRVGGGDLELSTGDAGLETVIETEVVGKVRRLVARLPQRQREVVVLRVFEEMSVRDTARVMGCREGTVKALLNKAMTSLRSMSSSLTAELT
jgi:RNA polymerase sigma-70 factor (ECF subfamily)